MFPVVLRITSHRNISNSNSGNMVLWQFASEHADMDSATENAGRELVISPADCSCTHDFNVMCHSVMSACFITTDQCIIIIIIVINAEMVEAIDCKY